jgi:hypothetical protein
VGDVLWLWGILIRGLRRSEEGRSTGLSGQNKGTWEMLPIQWTCGAAVQHAATARTKRARCG